MPGTYPSIGAWDAAAKIIGCDIPAIKAVFEVEASGKFYESSGKLVRRFEPHHFPRQHWPTLGFNPGSTAPWRASLKLRTSTRRRMFDIAEGIDAEACYDATSWGAPQIMGFNAELSGFANARDMVAAFERSADEQIIGFASFVVNSNLDGAVRSHDWLAFATGYNGSGQAQTYAAKIETAFRRQSGGAPSASIMRIGSVGDNVRQLQEQLVSLGYEMDVDGHYGNQTFAAVRDFQRANGLTVDGIAGAVTQRKIVAAGGAAIVPDRATRSMSSTDSMIDKTIERGTAVVGAGGVSGLLAGLDETTQQILIGGIVVGVIVIAALWITRKRR